MLTIAYAWLDAAMFQDSLAAPTNLGGRLAAHSPDPHRKAAEEYRRRYRVTLVALAEEVDECESTG